MNLRIKRGTTGKLVRVFIPDASKTDGSGLTGLTNATSGLVAYYIREGAASATAITLSAGTVGTWSSGGFKEIDATHLPGWYELGLPDAALATGNSVIAMLSGGTGMSPVSLEIQLDAVDYQDAVHFGLSALPNVAAGADGGLPTGNASGQVAVGSYATGQDPATLLFVTPAHKLDVAADGSVAAGSFALDQAATIVGDPRSRTVADALLASVSQGYGQWYGVPLAKPT